MGFYFPHRHVESLTEQAQTHVAQLGSELRYDDWTDIPMPESSDVAYARVKKDSLERLAEHIGAVMKECKV